MKNMRVLGAIRQSKTKDRAVSPAAQRTKITKWAEDNGHQVVTFTEDLSLSGKLSAFKRPELGPCLTDPVLIGTWDILVTTKIDRACRNTKDFLTIIDWCKEHDKSYVSLRENIDMTTAQGRQAARDAASRAEWERDMASERRLETLEELAEEGRWPGGRVPYGMRAEEREDGYYLVPDIGNTADIANTMADKAIAGLTNLKIRDWLNGEGHVNTIGIPWTTERVRYVLHSEAMEQILGHEKNAQLKLALLSRSPVRGHWESGKNFMLGIGFCSICGRQLYLHKARTRRVPYYRCQICRTYIPQAKLDEQTEAAFLFVWGDEMRHTRVIRLGDQKAAERFELTRQLEVLKAITDAGVSGPIAEIQAKLDELTASIEPHTEEWVPSGQTVEEYWDSLETVKERNEFLRACHFQVKAGRHHFGFKINDLGIIQAAHVLDVPRCTGSVVPQYCAGNNTRVIA